MKHLFRSSALASLLAVLASCATVSAPNYSSGPCQDNCGGNATCVANCQEVHGQPPRTSAPLLIGK